MTPIESVAVGLGLGIVIGEGLVYAWFGGLSCAVLGHAYDPHQYGPGWCYRAARPVDKKGRHVK